MCVEHLQIVGVCVCKGVCVQNIFSLLGCVYIKVCVCRISSDCWGLPVLNKYSEVCMSLEYRQIVWVYVCKGAYV